MNDHLTALDSTFLELEQADQSAHMHIGGVMVFEPREQGVPAPAEVAEELGSRLVGLPRYRQCLSAPKTGGFHWPAWVEDPRFDARRHIRRARLPGSGTEEDLAEWAGDYFAQRLDRAMPLWELVVVDGLEDGRWALVSKTHHCMVDGVGSVDAATVMLDSEREPERDPRPDEPASGVAELPPIGMTGPSPAASLALRLASRALAAPAEATRLSLRAATAVAQALRRGARTAIHPDQAAEVLRRSRALAELLVRDELIAAPRTSLNDPIGAHRRLGVVEIDLDEVKRIKRDLGGTVNDVVLAAGAGAFRRLLMARGERLPRQGLRAMVPVNIRRASEHLALGNKITSLFIHLPVAEPDPLRRYERQVTEAEGLKSGTQAVGSSAVIDLAGHAPPIIHGALARSLYATRLFNVTITNVPGPQTPLYAFGSKMLSVWPIVPLAAEHAVGIAIFSYDGRLFFCANADRESVTDLDVLLEGIAESIEELSALRRSGSPKVGEGAGAQASVASDVAGAISRSSIAGRLFNGSVFY